MEFLAKNKKGGTAMNKIFNIIVSIALALAFVIIIYSPNDYSSRGDFGNIINNDGDSINNDVPQDGSQNNTDINQEINEPSENTSSIDDDTYTIIEEPFVYIDNGFRIQALVNLNVRKKPSGSSERIGILNKNDIAGYIDTYNNSWYKVYYNNTVAYVSANTAYSKLVDNNLLLNNQAKVNKVIDAGMKLLGTPYEYGAQRIFLWNLSYNPNFTGRTYDCSSFIQYIYYVGANIKINGDSRSQSKNGILIEHHNIIRGDILVMTSTARQYNTGIERIGHVAIYLGNNKILHTFGTGGVRIQDYSEFWRGRFIMARRIIY